MIFFGIDPGWSGGLGLIEIGHASESVKFDGMTEKDVADLVKGLLRGAPVFGVIESVHSMPGQGVSSSFKFGKNFGLLLGCLYSQKIPFELVTPQKWQKAMGCLTGGDKNISKAAAQRLFPEMKITHAVADALLLAEYCRRICLERGIK